MEYMDKESGEPYCHDGVQIGLGKKVNFEYIWVIKIMKLC